MAVLMEQNVSAGTGAVYDAGAVKVMYQLTLSLFDMAGRAPSDDAAIAYLDAACQVFDAAAQYSGHLEDVGSSTTAATSQWREMVRASPSRLSDFVDTFNRNHRIY